MQYINPYELLNISATSLSDIDSKTIIREKKKLFQEIELSEHNIITYKGIEVTRSECIKAIDELDYKNKQEFHFFIYQNKPLNDFLSIGSLSFFENYKVESIYKLSAFTDFISPFFDQQYDKVLSNNFKCWEKEKVSIILSVKPITDVSSNENCYKSTYQLLKEIDNEINKLKNEITSNNSPHTNNKFTELSKVVKRKINVELLNFLPLYFQNIRNQIASSINNLSTAVFNKPHFCYTPAFELMEIAKSISIDGLVAQTITKDYFLVEKRYKDELEESKSEKQKSTLDKYFSLIDKIITKRNDVTNKAVSAYSIDSWVTSNIPIAELNSLPSSAFEIKNLTALSLKSLSVSVWNNLDDLDIAISVLVKAITINVNEETKAQLVEAKIEFDALKLKIERQKELNKQRLLSSNSKKKSGNGELIVIISIVAFIIIIWLTSTSNNSYNTRSNNSDNNSMTPTSVDTTKADINSSSLPNNNNASNNSYPSEPVYNKVLMKDGNIPGCESFEPKYDKSISTKIIISAEMTDIALKLYDNQTDKCIRFVFISDGTTYTVKNIPEGKYYLKIAYGNDWSVKEGDPLCKGHFTTHVSYKRDGDIYDFNKTYYDNGRVSTPYYTLKLYRSYSSLNSENSSTSNSISETDFNNN